MSRLKIFVVLMVVVMIITAVFTGCGATNSGSAASTATETSVVAASTAAASSDASTTVDLKPVTISMAVGFANFEPIIEKLAEEYKKIHPNVSVDLVASGTNDYSKALQTMIAAGNYPEIALVGRGAAEKQFVDNDLLVDLSDSPVAGIMTDLNKQTHTYNGKIYTVSTGVGTYGLIYNKEVLAKAGIVNPPRTLTELKEVCKLLSSKGITPFMPQFKTDWACGQFFQYGIDPILVENPGMADEILSGKAKITDSKFLDVFNYIDVMKENAGKRPFDYETFGNGVAEFAKGNAAMAIHGDWLVPPALEIDKTLADKVGMVGIPWSEDSAKNRLVIFYNDGYGIFKQSKNVDEGIKFFDYFFSIENQNILGKESGNPSPLKGADTSFAYKYTQQILADELDPANVYGDLEFSKLPGTITSEMNSAIQGYLAGAMKKEQVLEKLQNAIDMGLQNQ